MLFHSSFSSFDSNDTIVYIFASCWFKDERTIRAASIVPHFLFAEREEQYLQLVFSTADITMTYQYRLFYVHISTYSSDVAAYYCSKSASWSRKIRFGCNDWGNANVYLMPNTIHVSVLLKNVTVHSSKRFQFSAQFCSQILPLLLILILTRSNLYSTSNLLIKSNIKHKFPHAALEQHPRLRNFPHSCHCY